MPKRARNSPPNVLPDVVLSITASAARTSSLEHLLTEFDLNPATAAVVVLQYREALDENAFFSVMKSAGKKITRLDSDGPIRSGEIYLVEPDMIVTIAGGKFDVRPSNGSAGERGTIDSFLVALAREEQFSCVAVALAGTDGDGTLGFKTIKETGGLALAEENEESQSGELAHSNSPAAIADIILPIQDLVKRLDDTVGQLLRKNGKEGPQRDSSDVRSALSTIATVLRNKTGHDFHGYKEGTFMRRIQRRMQVLQIEELEKYALAIRDDPEEAQQLFNDLLIGVTQFFRDTREFELLEREIVPKLFKDKTREDHLRVWVVGCSTGDEAYSIGILLREHMAHLEQVPHIQIFATDLDGRALASARAGRYAEDIARTMSPERLARWFIKEGNTYCVVKELREMCIFSQHSIIKDAPFSRLDLISCRNLLIYLDADMQDRVIPLFHFALKPGGALFLGNSENVSRHTSLFAAVEGRSRIYRRVENGRRTLPDFPFTATDRHIVPHASTEVRSRSIEAGLARRAERLAERHSPAYVIVDDGYNVLHFSGRIGQFIDPAGGAASLHLFQLIHPDLRLDLRTALGRAADEGNSTIAGNVLMGTNGHRILVDLIVEPMREGASQGFFILFKEGAAVTEHAAVSSNDASEQTRRLRDELQTTKDRLQATVEELESTNEELKSSNEEYQSLNEELQSANEELETSKEELQSVNEELTTVNGELAHRVQELTRATSDLKNFLESTQIATIFLDNELKVTNYTPAVAELFHLVDSDLGRPIAHIKSRIDYEELADDVRRVLRTLAPIEREVAGPEAHYMVRVLPYRSVDNFIAGAVVTFVDITERQKAEEARRRSEERFRAIVESVRDYAIYIADSKGRIEEWLQGAEAIFGWSAQEAVGQDASILDTPEDRTVAAFEKELMETKDRGSASNIRWHLRKDGRRVFIEGTAQALRDSHGNFRGIIKIGQDITERKKAEEALKQSEAHSKLLLAELQHRVRNTLAVIRSIARRTARMSSSVDDFATHLDGRLNAFARVQSSVTRNPTVGIDLSNLILDELHAAGARDGENLTLDGPQIRLRPKAAELFGLAIHELTTNAIKYGALATEAGKIKVSWTVSTKSPPALEFIWSETGLRSKPKAPNRRGFGSEIIEHTIAYELDARTSLDMEASGIRCRIVVPFSEILHQP